MGWHGTTATGSRNAIRCSADEYLTGPGHLVTSLDGEDMSAVFEAFIHAPFVGEFGGEGYEEVISVHGGTPSGPVGSNAIDGREPSTHTLLSRWIFVLLPRFRRRAWLPTTEPGYDSRTQSKKCCSSCAKATGNH